MTTVNPQEWLNLNWPNCKALDHDWTMERYDYPLVVRNWIKENWIKVSDNNGGTYHEPRYHRYRTESKNRFNQRKEYYENEKNHEQQMSPQASQQKSKQKSQQKSQESEKKFAKTYLESELSNNMDDANKKALNVMATKGASDAIKYMFTDQESGSQLSYSEMRSRYG